MNRIHQGAISEMVILAALKLSVSFSLFKDMSRCTDSASRLQLVEAAGKSLFFMSSSFDPLQVGSGRQDNELRSFLQQCKHIHQQRMHRAGAGLTRSSSDKKERVSSGKEASPVSARSSEGHKRNKTEEVSISKRKYSDIYVQGASSFTDLSSRREEHQSMVRGGGKSISRHSSTSSESLDLYAPFMGATLDRVHSMESGISQDHTKSWRVQDAIDQSAANLPRSASQGNLPPVLQHSSHRPPVLLSKSSAQSAENFHTHTAVRKAPSYVQLGHSGEDLMEEVHALEDRVGILATRFLYERQDMFKQILRGCE